MPLYIMVHRGQIYVGPGTVTQLSVHHLNYFDSIYCAPKESEICTRTPLQILSFYIYRHTQVYD